MLDTAVLLDLAISAVVVGQQQAFRRDKLACAAASEKHDGIFQRSLIDTVDVFCAELEALFLHVSDALRDQGRQPHSFVSIRCHSCENTQQYDSDCLLHNMFSISYIFL